MMARKQRNEYVKIGPDRNLTVRGAAALPYPVELRSCSATLLL